MTMAKLRDACIFERPIRIIIVTFVYCICLPSSTNSNIQFVACGRNKFSIANMEVGSDSPNIHAKFFGIMDNPACMHDTRTDDKK